jgi:hypothetical protein
MPCAICKQPVIFASHAAEHREEPAALLCEQHGAQWLRWAPFIPPTLPRATALADFIRLVSAEERNEQDKQWETIGRSALVNPVYGGMPFWRRP